MAKAGLRRVANLGLGSLVEKSKVFRGGAIGRGGKEVPSGILVHIPYYDEPARE